MSYRRAIAWSIIAIGMIACRVLFLEDVIYNIDEAEYAVAADALSSGWLPGVDLLGSTKPPGIVLLCKLLFECFGRSLGALHVAHLVMTIGAGFVVVEIAAILLGAAALIPAALFYWMVVNGFSLPEELLSFSVETPGVLFAVTALWLALSNSSRGAMITAGCCFGLALLFRQSFLPFAVPVLLAYDTGVRKRAAVYGGVGIGLVWLPICGLYAAHGGLGWAWDSWVRYPLTYSGDLGFDGFLTALILNFRDFAIDAPVPLMAAIVGLVFVWRERKFPARIVLLALCGASFLALCAGSRFYGHYFIQMFPALAVLGAVSYTVIAKCGRVIQVLGACVVLFGIYMSATHFPLWRSRIAGAPPRGMSFYALSRDELELKTGAFAREHTTPDETIAVWGYCPQIYYHAQRRPSVRDYLCHYTTGYSPSAFEPHDERAPRAFGHPQAEAMFIEDVEARKPRYIFDLVQVVDYEFTFFQYSLRSYANLGAYLRSHYLPDGAIGDVLIYRRRTPQDTWQPETNETHPDEATP